MTSSDVAAAVREQNSPVATGAIGQQPSIDGQQTQITLSTFGRLKTSKQFENIILKTAPVGRDDQGQGRRPGRAGGQERGRKRQARRSRRHFLAIFQMPDANALDTHDRVIAKMEELKKDFPDGLDYDHSASTRRRTRENRSARCIKTLRDAIILVAVVVLLFLQNWRSSIIPLVAVPVAIVGTFAVDAAIRIQPQ